MTGTKLELGPVKDVLVATTWEGSEGFNNYLYGIGFALNCHIHSMQTSTSTKQITT
jgi:nucleoside-specific outer membrane channel protein Tsx